MQLFTQRSAIEALPTLVPSPSKLQRRQLTLSLGLLFAGVIVISIVRLLVAEFWFDHYDYDLLIQVSAQKGTPTLPLLDEDECVGWRRTGRGSPNGPRRPQGDADCNEKISSGMSGYCEYRHKFTNASERLLPVFSDTFYKSASIQCSQASDLLAYGVQSLAYIHDPSFSIAQIQDQIWYREDELNVAHPLLQDLVRNHGVILRKIQVPRATNYYTKLHAVFYSAFDHVLLMDADSFAVKDPRYLFETPEYQATGAMFWPDFWQPSRTWFNVHERSLIWTIFGVKFVNMFEQESGQVLINRVRHQKALNVLMYYGFKNPAVHEDLHLVCGDKDLFRLAWLKSNSSFHYIARHAGSAGLLDAANGKFCGVTMVQHDPKGEIVFLHRNQEKLAIGSGNNRVWTHVQQSKKNAPNKAYRIGSAKVFNDMSGCMAVAEDWQRHFTVTPTEVLAWTPSKTDCSN